MNTQRMNQAMKKEFLKAIISEIENKAPEVATRCVRGNRYEGEETFYVNYNQFELECKRRSAYLDTSELDYYTGTGYSYDVIYDDIAVMCAYDSTTDEENEELCHDLNEMLCVS